MTPARQHYRLSIAERSSRSPRVRRHFPGSSSRRELRRSISLESCHRPTARSAPSATGLPEPPSSMHSARRAVRQGAPARRHAALPAARRGADRSNTLSSCSCSTAASTKRARPRPLPLDLADLRDLGLIEDGPRGVARRASAHEGLILAHDSYDQDKKTIRVDRPRRQPTDVAVEHDGAPAGVARAGDRHGCGIGGFRLRRAPCRYRGRHRHESARLEPGDLQRRINGHQRRMASWQPLRASRARPSI